MTKEFDLVILGSGATAFAAALRAAELGKPAAIAEWRTLGGTCVNRGCLPSKNLIEAAKIFYDSTHPRYPGIVPASMGLDFRALIEQKDRMIHDYRDKKYQSIVTDSETLKVLMGRARFVGPNQVAIGKHVPEISSSGRHGWTDCQQPSTGTEGKRRTNASSKKGGHNR